MRFEFHTPLLTNIVIIITRLNVFNLVLVYIMFILLFQIFVFDQMKKKSFRRAFVFALCGKEVIEHHLGNVF